MHIYYIRTTILFPYKDKIPKFLQSYVIYEYSCRCSASYVGQTTGNLGKRIAEHKGISERTSKVRGTQLHSAIRDHSEKYHHPIDPESFKVIGTAKNDTSLDILEMLHIKFRRPSLNLQTDTEKLITIWTPSQAHTYTHTHIHTYTHQHSHNHAFIHTDWYIQTPRTFTLQFTIHSFPIFIPLYHLLMNLLTQSETLHPSLPNNTHFTTNNHGWNTLFLTLF